MNWRILVGVMSVTMLPGVAIAASARSCEEMRAVRVEGMTVTFAESVKAGAEPKYPKLPAFCRVAATLRPTSDSEIKIEVWMPEGTAWNGKYEGTGNGGWGGSIDQGELAGAVMRGYAAASTDTGHTGGSASFALGHPEKLVDFGWRSVHGMTLAAKSLIAAFYGEGPKLAYFQGCSSGGRQALMEAQRFPEDYDGIIAGATTNNWTQHDGGQDLGGAGDAIGCGELHPAGEVSDDPQGGTGAVRCDGRGEGWGARRSTEVQVRSGGP